ncbi:hypothetical protein GCM10010156_75530 [Planobispora rosea]|uniref:Uncharacterized protein n=1 Tax=Planobispora rosea TaxID=35762 RepID=A0A8J3WH41_PLARO|nr:hypothetical protein GCM10010156_75530 [Planobispora rosea]GIH89103.1 hypothetical protein Pro02_75110 [Planobispora rosea]
MTRRHPGRSSIDGDTRDLGLADASTDAIAALDDDDVIPRPGELIRCREPCEPGTDDDDVGGSGAGTVHDRSVRVWPAGLYLIRYLLY